MKIGSSHARLLIKRTVNPEAPIRKNIGLGELAKFIWVEAEHYFREVFQDIQFLSDSDISSVALAVSHYPRILQNWNDLGKSCSAYLYNISDERRLVSLLKDGGPTFSPAVLTRLIEVWTSWISFSIARQANINDIAKLVNEYQHQLKDSPYEISQQASELAKRFSSYLVSWDTDLPQNHRVFVGAGSFEAHYNRIETTHAVSLRICALQSFLTSDMRRQAILEEESLRPQGTRRVWLKATTTAIKAESKSEEIVRTALNWLAIGALILALIGLGLGGVVIILGTGIFSFALASRFLYSVIGSAWVKPYDPSNPAKTVNRKTVDLSLWTGSWAALIVVAAVLFSGQIDARLIPDSEVSSPVIDSFEPSQSTYATVPTTEPLLLEINTFSLSDVTADGFTENGEINISEFLLPSEGESELRYRMAVSDNYISLSDNYKVRACWQQESVPDLLVSCAERVFMRIGRNSSGVIYETSVLMRPDSPTGRWWLSLDFLDTSTSITSPSSLMLRASDEDSPNPSVDMPPFVSTTTPQPNSFIDQSASAYASAMAQWTSTGFQEMMNLSETNSPAWKYAFHLYNGRLSEIQAGRKDGSQVSTKPAGSGIRVCLTSSCSTLLDNFEFSNGRLSDLNINNRPVRDSVVTNSESNSWVCGAFGACATLRSASWFGGTVYVNLEIQLNNSAAGTATRAAVVLVPPTGSTKAFTAGTTPLATISQNAHYLVSFPYSSEPWPGAIRVKVKTSLGTETLQVPLVNP